MTLSRRAALAGAVLSATAALLAPAGAQAQERFPSRQITLVVPAPPGGGTDTFARLLAELVEPTFGQKMVVENRPGGGGAVGTTLATQARPDGYTLLLAWSGPITAGPHSMQVAYTPDSYKPIFFIGSSAYVMCAKADFPAADPNAFIANLKANPGRYTYGADGIGGSGHLGISRAFRALGVNQRMIPFSGSGETLRNFLGGHVTFYVGSITTILPHVRSGTAKCHMLTSAENNPALPGTASIGSLGHPEAATTLWWGVFGPRALPADRVQIIFNALTEAAKSQRFLDTLQAQGVTRQPMPPEQFERNLRAEYTALGEVAKAIGLQRATR